MRVINERNIVIIIYEYMNLSSVTKKNYYYIKKSVRMRFEEGII